MIENSEPPLTAPSNRRVPDILIEPESLTPIKTPEETAEAESRFVMFQASDLPRIPIVQPETPKDIGEPFMNRSETSVKQIDAAVGYSRTTLNQSTNKDKGPTSATNARSTSIASPSIVSAHKSPSSKEKGLQEDDNEQSLGPEAPNILARIKSMFHKELITEDDDELFGLQLTAHVIRNGESHLVPHFGRLGIKKSQAKSLFARRRNPEWVKTFAFLDDEEMSALQIILTPDTETLGDGWTRSLILLKRIRKARFKFWQRGEKPLLAIVGDQPAFEDDSMEETETDGDRGSFFFRKRREASSQRNNAAPLNGSFAGRRALNPTLPISNANSLSTTNRTPANLSQRVPLPPRTAVPLPNRGPPDPPRNFSPPSPFPATGHQPPPNPDSRIPEPPQRRSFRAQDISQRPMLETECRDRLTTYEVHTIQRIEPQDPNQTSWDRCHVTRESLSGPEIVHRVNDLNDKGPTAMQKKASLSPSQQLQITHLIDHLTQSETDMKFEWTLAQLEEPVSTSPGKVELTSFSPSKVEASSTLPKGPTTPLVVYLRKSPRNTINCVELYREAERSKNEGSSSLNRPMNSPQIQQPQQQQVPLGTRQVPPKANLSKASVKKSKSKKRANGSDSDSDTECTNSTSVQSSSDNRPRRAMTGDRRKHGRKSKVYYTDEHPLRSFTTPYTSYGPRGGPAKYVPDMPARSEPHFDPVAAAYQAGKIDADAERFGPVRHYDDLPPMAVRAPDRPEAEYREVMNRANVRYRGNAEQYAREEQRRRREAEEYSGRQVYEPPLPPKYPEYHDRSRYDVRAEPRGSEAEDDDGQELVKQLLLEWTPGGLGENDTPKEDNIKIPSVRGSSHQDDMRPNPFKNWGTTAQPIVRNPDLAQPRSLVDSPVEYAQSYNEDFDEEELLKNQDGDSKEKGKDTGPQKGKGKATAETHQDSEEPSARPRQSSTTTSATKPVWLDRDYARIIVGGTRRATIPDQIDPLPESYQDDREPRSREYGPPQPTPARYPEMRYSEREYPQIRYSEPRFSEPMYPESRPLPPSRRYPESLKRRFTERSEPSRAFTNPAAQDFLPRRYRPLSYDGRSGW